MWGRDNNCQNCWASVLDYDKVNKLSSSYRVSQKKCDSYCHLYLRPYLCYSFIFIWAEIAGPPVHLYIETCQSDKPFWRYLQIHFENGILKFWYIGLDGINIDSFVRWFYYYIDLQTSNQIFIFILFLWWLYCKPYDLIIKTGTSDLFLYAKRTADLLSLPI